MSIADGTSPAPDQSVIRWSAYGFGIAGGLLPFFLRLAHAEQASFVLSVVVLAWPLAMLGWWLGFREAFSPAPGAPMAGASVAHGFNILLLLPLFSLCVYGLTADLLDFRPTLLFGLAGAAIGLLVGLWAPRRPVWPAPTLLVIILAVLGAAYGVGAAAFANIRFDQGPGEQFQARVTRLYVFPGRRTRTYHLRLAPWGPVTTETDASVPGGTYWTLNVGDTVCVTLHPGALHMGWYRAARC